VVVGRGDQQQGQVWKPFDGGPGVQPEVAVDRRDADDADEGRRVGIARLVPVSLTSSNLVSSATLPE